MYTQPKLEDLSAKKIPIAEIQFPIYDILGLMAQQYVLESNEKIVKASIASAQGVLKKFNVSEEIFKTYSSRMSYTILDNLEDAFLEELRKRFTQQDFIILNFYENIIELNLTEMFSKSTEDFRILFEILFVTKLDTTVTINNKRINCNNCSFISELIKTVNKNYEYSYVKISYNEFPFFFVKEDFDKKEILSKRFKKIQSLRKK